MRLLMDADCLIKLTKAGLKERVANSVRIFIPEAVRKEVVVEGKRKGCADAYAVEENVTAGLVSVISQSLQDGPGDNAVLASYRKADFDAVATDDSKLTRKLRAYGIPFVLPALVVYHLMRSGALDKAATLKALDQLAEFVSEDEISTVQVLLEGLE
jgi:rRNA-processing protein FCF1